QVREPEAGGSVDAIAGDYTTGTEGWLGFHWEAAAIEKGDEWDRDNDRPSHEGHAVGGRQDGDVGKGSSGRSDAGVGASPWSTGDDGARQGCSVHGRVLAGVLAGV